jgi:hypothetical protein
MSKYGIRRYKWYHYNTAILDGLLSYDDKRVAMTLPGILHNEGKILLTVYLGLSIGLV